MAFFTQLSELCPVHFSADIDGMMSIFDNGGGSTLWGGFLMEQAPFQQACLCAKDPSDDHDNHNKHAGDAIHAGPLAEDSIVISGQPLVHPTPAVGGSSSSPTRSKSSEVLTSAPADVAVSHAAIPKLFTCDHCDSISAKTPRDFNRHLATKKHRKNATKAGNNQVALEDLQPSASGTVFRCPVASCGQAYSRKDNLWRHIAAMHDI